MQTKWWFLLAIIVLFVSMIAGISLGAYKVTLGELSAHLFGTGNYDESTLEMSAAVFWDIRLPRVLTALIVGAALAIAGAALQGLFRNPLVDAGIIGTASGATFTASLYLFFSGFLSIGSVFFNEFALSISAFLGALLATVLVMKISTSVNGISPSLLILAGISVNALVGAATGLLIFFADDDQLRDITFWTLGSLGGSTWNVLIILSPIIAISLFFVVRRSADLNAFQLGEQTAYFMGVPVKRTKLILLIAITVMIGTCVSFVGIIGFVGLIVPHISRLLLGNNYKVLIPFSAIAGGILLILADLFSRTILAPTEIPIGIITSFLGGPFFLYLIIKNKSKLSI